MFEFKMPLYRFYKIYSDLDDNICYLGKTTKNINERFATHKSEYKHNYIRQCYSKKVFEKYGIDNVKIELLEEIDFEYKYEADKKEREYIESFNNCVNKQLPSQTKKEKDKKWIENNKQHKKEYDSQPYYCEICNKTIRLDSKIRHNKSQTHLNKLN